MAIDKSRTTVGVKIMLIALSVTMVAYLGSSLLGIADLFRAGTPKQNTSTTDVLGQIAQKYTSTVAAFDAALRSDPASYTVLVNQGNTYFDWGMEVGQEIGKNQSLAGNEQPLFLSARTFYERAMKIKQEPAVAVDLAISYYYSGETSQAIAAAKTVADTTPDFAPAWFNLGVFYSGSGQNQLAIAAFEKSLALDPTGTKSTNPDYAKQMLQSLKGSANASGTP